MQQGSSPLPTPMQQQPRRWAGSSEDPAASVSLSSLLKWSDKQSHILTGGGVSSRWVLCLTAVVGGFFSSSVSCEPLSMSVRFITGVTHVSMVLCVCMYVHYFLLLLAKLCRLCSAVHRSTYIRLLKANIRAAYRAFRSNEQETQGLLLVQSTYL